ncbi:MAG: DUF2124 domain-containing protein [Methanoregula sp.]|nr:MAG: DUF2124 domain-containing protein [Methanoregula sp.]
MTQTETLRGVPGILRPFKEYLQSSGLAEGDQIVYYGCVGTCTPFVELLAVAVRGLKFEQVFVPFLNESKAKVIHNVDDVGMQVSEKAAVLRPKALIIMGGLAMPNVPVTKEEVQDIIGRHGGAKVIGVCFMNMFEKAGWLTAVKFDVFIDATIDPVRVVKKSP